MKMFPRSLALNRLFARFKRIANNRVVGSERQANWTSYHWDRIWGWSRRPIAELESI